MLVSLVCVLLLMMAYTQLFSDVGSKVGAARSMIELNSRMRSAAQRLRSDLESHTCDMTLWQRPETGSGYFEIIEGPLCDKTPRLRFAVLNNGLTSAAYTAAYPVTSGLFNSGNSIEKYPLGDTDDVLMFTIRSKEGPYIGTHLRCRATRRFNPTWRKWCGSCARRCRPIMSPPSIHRLTRCIAAYSWCCPPGAAGRCRCSWPTSPTAQDDISAHNEFGHRRLRGNTLSDLTKRECRYAHAYVTPPLAFNGFPHTVDPAKLVPFGGKLSGGTYQSIESWRQLLPMPGTAKTWCSPTCFRSTCKCGIRRCR